MNGKVEYLFPSWYVLLKLQMREIPMVFIEDVVSLIRICQFCIFLSRNEKFSFKPNNVCKHLLSVSETLTIYSRLW